MKVAQSATDEPPLELDDELLELEVETDELDELD